MQIAVDGEEGRKNRLDEQLQVGVPDEVSEEEDHRAGKATPGPYKKGP